jgi:hypothetical protein
MYDVIYAAEIALCNINKLPLQLYLPCDKSNVIKLNN